MHNPMTIRSLTARFTVSLGACCLLIAGIVHAAGDEVLFEAASHEQSALIETLQDLVMIESGSHDASISGAHYLTRRSFGSV
jgi:hypothetical protein